MLGTGSKSDFSLKSISFSFQVNAMVNKCNKSIVRLICFAIQILTYPIIINQSRWKLSQVTHNENVKLLIQKVPHSTSQDSVEFSISHLNGVTKFEEHALEVSSHSMVDLKDLYTLILYHIVQYVKQSGMAKSEIQSKLSQYENQSLDMNRGKNFFSLKLMMIKEFRNVFKT